MTSVRIALASALLVLAACSDSTPDVSMQQPGAEPGRLEAHLRFLADDLLEGREAGTRGFDIAAAYVASQFAALGLSPAGDNGGWLQTVPLLKATRLQAGSQFALERAGGRVEFAFQTDYLPGVNYRQREWHLSAPLVFVGQAVVAPEFDHDDLAGVDLTGKIAVMLSGAPERFPNDPRAFYSSGREKMRLVAERGAIGVVFLGDPERESKYPWARGAANWERPSMRLRDEHGDPVDIEPTLVGGASLNVASAELLFAGAPMSASEVFARLEEGTLEAFDIPGVAFLSGAAELSPLVSYNVVAQRPGNDPALATEHVVFSAHLDHVGIGAAVDGDRIYNGALDNALGVALLLETARLAMQGPETPRSRVFIAVTAEEKGLLGAEHFAEHPSVEGTLVVNVNMDMPVILGPQDDVLPIGIEHSSMQAVVEQAAQELGVTLSPDPFPEEVVFVRSDQYAFIRRGVPAIYLDGGIHSTIPEVDGREQLTGFLRNHYHQPSDQADLPIHYPSAARLADLNHRIGVRVATDPERPHWNEGDFFGDRFAPPK